LQPATVSQLNGIYLYEAYVLPGHERVKQIKKHNLFRNSELSS